MLPLPTWREPAVGFAVGHEGFGVGAGDAELLGPEGGGAAAPRAGDGDGGVEGVPLFDAGAEERCERAGLALRVEGVVFILHGGALAQNQVAARADVGF